MKINEEQKQQYQEYVKQVTPTHNLLKEVGKAFLTGGLICVLGQFLQNTGLNIGIETRRLPAPGAQSFWLFSVFC